jgi:hypothetical protein
MGPVSLLINLLDTASTNLMTFLIIFLGTWERKSL